MPDSNYTKILSTVAPENFVGRTPELDRLRRHAAGDGDSPALLVSSAPATGASELLKQTYDRLFHEQNTAIPIYFAVKDSDRTAKHCAVARYSRFGHELNVLALRGLGEEFFL